MSRRRVPQCCECPLRSHRTRRAGAALAVVVLLLHVAAAVAGAAPVITAISPASGFPGDAVAISGSGLLDVNLVRFGALEVASFTIAGDDSIVAIVPPEATGGPIVVRGAGSEEAASLPFRVGRSTGAFATSWSSEPTGLDIVSTGPLAGTILLLDGGGGSDTVFLFDQSGRMLGHFDLDNFDAGTATGLCYIPSGPQSGNVGIVDDFKNDVFFRVTTGGISPVAPTAIEMDGTWSSLLTLSDVAVLGTDPYRLALLHDQIGSVVAGKIYFVEQDQTAPPFAGEIDLDALSPDIQAPSGLTYVGGGAQGGMLAVVDNASTGGKKIYFVDPQAGTLSSVAPNPVSLAALDLADPQAVAYVGAGTYAGALAVADQSADRVYFVDQAGALLGDFGVAGPGLISPDGIGFAPAGDHAGELAIGDTATDALVYFDVGGAVAAAGFDMGAVTAKTVQGVGFVADDAAGNVMLVVPQEDRVYFRAQDGSAGSLTPLDTAAAGAVDPEDADSVTRGPQTGLLAVVDRTLDAILFYAPTGELSSRLDMTSEITQPRGIAFISFGGLSGTYAVVNEATGAREIHFVDPTGAVVQTIPAGDVAAGGFGADRPLDLAFVLSGAERGRLALVNAETGDVPRVIFVLAGASDAALSGGGTGGAEALTMSALENGAASARAIYTVTLADSGLHDRAGTKVDGLRFRFSLSGGMSPAELVSGGARLVVGEQSWETGRDAGIEIVATGEAAAEVRAGTVVTGAVENTGTADLFDTGDGGEATAVLSIWLAASGVTDGGAMSLVVDEGDVDLDEHGSDFSDPGTQGLPLLAIDVEVTATELRFGSEPADVVSGALLLPAPLIRATDAAGNVDRDVAEAISLGLAAGAGTLTGTQSLAMAQGVADFGSSALRYQAVTDREIFGLQADDDAGAGADLAPALSSALTADVVAASLRFDAEPGTAFDGFPLAPAPLVSARDADGLIDQDFVELVSLSLLGGAGELAGEVSLPAVAGIADWAGASPAYTGAVEGEAVQLAADDEAGTGADLPPAISDEFTATLLTPTPTATATATPTVSATPTVTATPSPSPPGAVPATGGPASWLFVTAPVALFLLCRGAPRLGGRRSRRRRPTAPWR
ncbi:MAG: IPT/TIG domain-containing protein [Candidatus Schekmanbacteria bacterium]|nr:IPT/TIG domain-containing protein [Candidatus Schekmanbacteria bacterium]